MSGTTSEMLLELQGVTKTFAATTALADVDFDLRAGEIHAICGENGAGKSTLIKVLAGVIHPDQGKFLLAGEEMVNCTPRLSLEKGVATIYQENSLFQNLSVAENIFVGHEPRRAGDLVDHARMKRLAAEIFKRLGVDIDVTATVSSLGGASQKIVEIARAFRQQARVLIMDEPSASLGHQETRLLFDVVREVVTTGTGVIFISHHLEEVFEIADRVTVLRDGCRISTRDAAETSQPQLIREMVGRDVGQVYNRVPQTGGDIAFENA